MLSLSVILHQSTDWIRYLDTLQREARFAPLRGFGLVKVFVEVKIGSMQPSQPDVPVNGTTSVTRLQRSPSMMVLVTGSADYIGSHMIHALVDASERLGVLDNLATGSIGR
jgi:hypothetical protein